MEPLLTLLADTDDDYFIGLSNKGTVKRAYKDMENLAPTVVWEDGIAVVNLGEETCRLKVPLGESSCSCPSRSICRHIIGAAIWLKGQKQEIPEGEVEAEKTETGKTELLEYPLKKLVKACKGRRYRLFCQKVRLGERPEMEEGSTVTVRFSEENIVVKLLEPLAYSTCSCHSKELCPHKAEALLWYQLEKGRISLEDLAEGQEEAKVWELESVKKLAEDIRETVQEQFQTGLSRISPSVTETMERMALLSHEEGLARLESCFRQEAKMYQMYFERSAAFRPEQLRRLLLTTYRMAGQLLAAEDQMELEQLAGNFRDTYEPVSKLILMGLGQRHFISKSGYEGDTFYFLELEKGEWYTWTDARPTFYDSKRRNQKTGEYAEAPWGLPCGRNQLTELVISLSGAKVARGGRLSSSQKTRGEIEGKRDFSYPMVRKLTEHSFIELLKKQFLDGRTLTFVAAKECREGRFDEIAQVFSMELLDEEGCSLEVTVPYRPEDEFLIRTLERMSQRLQREKCPPPVFFGSLSLGNGRLHLFPIEIFEEEGVDGDG